MEKYIIIWRYHDTHVELFETKEQALERFIRIEEEYKSYDLRMTMYSLGDYKRVSNRYQ